MQITTIRTFAIIRFNKAGATYLKKSGRKPEWTLSYEEAKQFKNTWAAKRCLVTVRRDKKTRLTCVVPFSTIHQHFDLQEPIEVTKKPRNKNYVVNLTVFVGGYEKNTVHIIRGKRKRETAIKRALHNECHESPGRMYPDSAGVYDDPCGEFSYCVDSVTEVSDDEAEILAKYL